MYKYRHAFLGDECPLAIVADIDYTFKAGNKATQDEPSWPDEVTIEDITIIEVVLTPASKHKHDTVLTHKTLGDDAYVELEGWLMDLAENDERLIEKLIEKART